MNALEIGKKLVAFCREGKNRECQDALYSKDIVSVEAGSAPGGDRTAKGIDAVHAKSKWWTDNHEVHSAQVSDPYPNGDDKFAVRFTYDVTLKANKQRFTMDEIAVFYVQNDKIVREEFYYSMGG